MHATTWVNLEVITASEIIHAKEQHQMVSTYELSSLNKFTETENRSHIPGNLRRRRMESARVTITEFMCETMKNFWK